MIAPLIALLSAAQPVRSLSAPTATTAHPAVAILGDVRELRDGRLIVNDAGARQLLRFDVSLRTQVVLRDSIEGAANGYGARAAMILPFHADSLIFVDATHDFLLVLSPSGDYVRAAAPLRVDDVVMLTRPGAGTDKRGRLVFRGASFGPRPIVDSLARTRAAFPADTAVILRADFDARRIDTLARLRVTGGNRTVRRETDTRVAITTYINPFPVVDDWTTLIDGTVAIVRGHDYHIDWIATDGAVTSSAKLPFDWRRIDDTEKRRAVDSAIAAQRARDSASAALRAGRGGGRAGQDGVRPGVVLVNEYAGATDIPDYYPPVRFATVTSDLAMNI